MKFLAREVREQGAQRIYLLTARGDISEAFYTKMGFYTSPKMILMSQRFDASNDQGGCCGGDSE